MARGTKAKKRQRAAARAASVDQGPSISLKGLLKPTPALYWTLAAGAALLLAAIAVMWPASAGKAYGDDPTYVFNNALLSEPDRLWKAWFVPGSFIEYYPIEQTLQWLEYLCFGMEPKGYHVVNILLHGLNTLAVWIFLTKLRLRFAWLGALIFAVYPLSVESVAYISEFKNATSLAPFVACMWFTVDFERDGRKSSHRWAVVFYAVAMMCKISPMCYPLVLLLYIWYLRGRITRQDLWNCLPFFIVSGVLSGISFWSGEIYNVNVHDTPPGPTPVGGLLSRLALIGTITFFNLGHVLAPVHPLVIYPLWQVDPPLPVEIIPWVLMAFAAAVLWWKRQSWGRPIILAVGGYLLFLLPALGFHNISYMCLTWVSDHFYYIPIILLIALTVGALEDIQNKLPYPTRPWLLVLPAVAVVAMAVQSYTYAYIFSDNYRLVAYEIIYNPGSWYLRASHGLDLLDEGKIDQGLSELNTSLAINPKYGIPIIAIATHEYKMGDYASAEAEFRKVIAIDRYASAGYFGLGSALAKEGRTQEAKEVFEQALQYTKPISLLYDDLAGVEAQLGQRADAITHYHQALELNPNDTYAQGGLQALGSD